VLQYYNLIRLGHAGYREIMEALAANARWLAAELGAMDAFELVADATDLPVVCLRLRGDPGFSVFDLSSALRQRGWIVPAYAMAPDAQHVQVLRIVVREGLSRDLANELVGDIDAALRHLAEGHRPDHPAGKPAGATPTASAGRKARPTKRETSSKKTRAVC
jgi:glutamate decarboxylase